MLPASPSSIETIDSLVTQGINAWREFLSQTNQQTTYDHQRQLSDSLASILQSLHTLVLAEYSNSKPIDSRCLYRLQTFCYLIKGVGLVVTLPASTVMSPTTHEQMITLRQTGDKDRDNTATLPISSSLPLSGPLRDLRTIPLPRSLLIHSSVDDSNVDTQSLAADIIKRLLATSQKGSDESDSDIAYNSASMLCIETARMWTDLSSSTSVSVPGGLSRGCYDTSDVDCLWAHAALAMLQDLLGTTAADNCTSEAAVPVTQLSVPRRVPVLSSAALVALLSTALHLVDRHELSSQALGTLLLWELLARHSSSR